MLDTLDTVKVCVAYDVDGERFEHLPYHQSTSTRSRRSTRSCPGWKTDLTQITERVRQLPAAAAGYLEFLEEQVGVPITLVGVGPGRLQFLNRAD